MKPIDCCTKRCFLCEEVYDQKPLSYYLANNDNLADRIIAESPHFIAFPDISPIVPGHSLILPKLHILSLAQIPHEYWSELKQIKYLVTNWVMQNFGYAFIFEHGTVQGGIESGLCIQHAHLHIIPARIDIINWLQAYTLTPINIKSLDIQKALSGIKNTYLYYEDVEGLGCVVHPIKSLPQQFIRMVVAHSYNLPNWDWKNIALPYLI